MEIVIDTGNQFKIFKIGERTFQIGDINLNNKNYNFFYDFTSLLDKGSKFIPCFYYDDFSIIRDLFLNVDKKTKNFNYQIFIKDSLICRSKDLSISNEFFEEDDLFKEFKRSILKKVIFLCLIVQKLYISNWNF